MKKRTLISKSRWAKINNAALRTSRETRKTELLAAWSIQDPKERHTAIKAAWGKYHQSRKAAIVEWNQGRRTIRVQFAQDAKNCKAASIETSNLETVEAVEE